MPYNSDSESCGSCSVICNETKGNNRSTLPCFSNLPALLPKKRQQENSPSLPARPSRLSLNIYRQRAHSRLIKDYYAENPVYDDVCFRKRFRMRKHLFLRIVEALGNHSKYFREKHDDDGRRRYSPLMKCTAAMRILAYGTESDVLEDYLQLGDNTTVECVREFAEGVVDVFGEQYLRRPNEADTARLLAAGEARGFPGMMGSIDYMHWEWDDCPRAWRRFCRIKDQKGENPTLVAEIAASHDLWIWHAFLGRPGNWNDIWLIERDGLFMDLCLCQPPKCEYMVNNRKYDTGYYVTNDVYPRSAAFVKPVPLAQDEKAKLFAQHQETVRRDAKRAFEVLQTRFAIVAGPPRFYYRNVLQQIIRACIILHNMIIEDERDSDELANDFSYEDAEDGVPTPQFSQDHLPQYEGHIRTWVRCGPDVDVLHYSAGFIRILGGEEEDDEQVRQHLQLQADLVEEVWQRFGSKD